MPKDVGETRHLGRLFVGDEDRAVAPRPELLSPVVEPPDLSRYVAGNVFHETRELLRRLRRHQQVRMVGEDRKSMDPHAVQPLGATEDADHEVVEPAAWAEQQAAVDGSQGDLDQGTGRDEAQRSSHVSSDEKRR